ITLFSVNSSTYITILSKTWVEESEYRFHANIDSPARGLVAPFSDVDVCEDHVVFGH
ncbi:hypothetical protein KI387_027940, partial [Taxus chinensis]